MDNTWTVGAVKHKGKWAFKKNRWKSVAVVLLSILIIAGYSIGYEVADRSSDMDVSSDTYSYSYDDPEFYYEEGIFGDDNEYYYGDDFSTDGYIFREPFSSGEDGPSVIFGAGAVGATILAAILSFIIGLAMLALAIIMLIFIYNPVTVGTSNFFFRNLKRNAEVKDILDPFDRDGYTNMVKIMIWRRIYLVGWTLLFIIPGLIKAYEYRMIPYIMAENPYMDKEMAFAESKRLMTGNKWHAFLLDLSFIGWHLLGAITFGIVEVLITLPYQANSDAVLYETLRYGNGGIVYDDDPEESVGEDNEF